MTAKRPPKKKVVPKKRSKPASKKRLSLAELNWNALALWVMDDY